MSRLRIDALQIEICTVPFNASIEIIYVAIRFTFAAIIIDFYIITYYFIYAVAVYVGCYGFGRTDIGLVWKRDVSNSTVFAGIFIKQIAYRIRVGIRTIIPVDIAPFFIIMCSLMSACTGKDSAAYHGNFQRCFTKDGYSIGICTYRVFAGGRSCLRGFRL